MPPRFDSPSVLGRLLDDAAGHFLIAPAASECASTWAYRAASLVLDTTWSCPEGQLVVTDAMALGAREQGHELGRAAPRVLLRQVRCTRGAVVLRVEFAPRPEFGLIHPRLTVIDGGVVADGGATVVVLSTPMDLDVSETCATGTFTMHEGQELTFALEQCDAWGPRVPVWTPRRIRRRLRTSRRSRTRSQRARLRPHHTAEPRQHGAGGLRKQPGLVEETLDG